MPEVQLVDRSSPTFASLDETLAMARRQLWLKEGSQKDDLLRPLVAEAVTERAGRFAFDWQPTKIGIASWLPR